MPHIEYPGDRVMHLAKACALGVALAGVLIVTAALPGSSAAVPKHSVHAAPTAPLAGVATHPLVGPVWLARAGGHRKHPFWRP